MNKITKIKSEKLGEIVCNLCKQANIYIPKDVYNAIFDSYKKESSPKAKQALTDILENIKLASQNNRPVCQDTGIVIVFIEIGQNVFIEGTDLQAAINQGVQKAYQENLFRKSIINDPIFDRINTNTNTPAIIYTNIVPGNSIKISVSIKGCGSENMSAVKMLNPSAEIDGIIEFILDTVKNAGSNSCPPIRLGIGIGGTMEYAAFLSKKALLQPLRSEKELINLSQSNKIAKLELDILRKINDLQIGVNGLGGNTTAFGVNILTFPTHIAALPVAVNINCHASRHAHAEILENKVNYFLDNFKYEFNDLNSETISCKQISTDDITAIKDLKAGEIILLNGYIYTARDAAHKKLIECINKGEGLPIDIKDKIIYYTGPCPPAKNEIIGPAGPTTSSRMDKYTPTLMNLGLLGTIGKGTRSNEIIDSIQINKGVYLVATGGAANLLSQRVVESEIIAYPELGPEAIYKLKLTNFPVTVAIDSNGNNILK